jgi:hypothetical protein
MLLIILYLLSTLSFLSVGFVPENDPSQISYDTLLWPESVNDFDDHPSTHLRVRQFSSHNVSTLCGSSATLFDSFYCMTDRDCADWLLLNTNISLSASGNVITSGGQGDNDVRLSTRCISNKCVRVAKLQPGETCSPLVNDKYVGYHYVWCEDAKSTNLCDVFTVVDLAMCV